MASSTTMPMASTRPNSVSALSEKPSSSITAKVPIRDTGTATSGMIEARQVCRNRITTSTTRIERLEQGVHHRVDRSRARRRWCRRRSGTATPCGEVLLQLLHGRAHGVGHLAGRWSPDAGRSAWHAPPCCRAGAQGVVVRAQLDAGHVAQVGDLRRSAPARDHDVAELLLGRQAALGVDGDLEVGLAGRGRGADLAGGHLDVLLAQRADHVAGGQAARRPASAGRARCAWSRAPVPNICTSPTP